MTRTARLADDLTLIDTRYAGTPEAVGVFLLTGDRPALIETGSGSTVDTLLEGIRAAGLDPRDLKALAVTHIHLDHAGAVGVLAQRYPHLDVYVHPLGAPHLIDPSRLLQSAGRLYGDQMDRLFGEVIPVPREQVHILEDGAHVLLGSRRITAIDTPGHARHHHVFHDPLAGDVFTGDAAGVALPGSRFVRPPTPPPEIDIPAWDATIARLRALRPRRLLLTHFGAHTWADALLTQLQHRLHEAVTLVQTALEDGLDEDTIIERLRAVAAAETSNLAGPGSSDRFEVVMAMRLSTLGLIRYVKRLG